MEVNDNDILDSFFTIPTTAFLIKKLTALANKLDAKGLHKQADEIDKIIKATESFVPPKHDNPHVADNPEEFETKVREWVNKATTLDAEVGYGGFEGMTIVIGQSPISEDNAICHVEKGSFSSPLGYSFTDLNLYQVVKQKLTTLSKQKIQNIIDAKQIKTTGGYRDELLPLHTEDEAILKDLIS